MREIIGRQQYSFVTRVAKREGEEGEGLIGAGRDHDLLACKEGEGAKEGETDFLHPFTGYRKRRDAYERALTRNPIGRRKQEHTGTRTRTCQVQLILRLQLLPQGRHKVSIPSNRAIAMQLLLRFPCACLLFPFPFFVLTQGANDTQGTWGRTPMSYSHGEVRSVGQVTVLVQNVFDRGRRQVLGAGGDAWEGWRGHGSWVVWWEKRGGGEVKKKAGSQCMNFSISFGARRKATTRTCQRGRCAANNASIETSVYIYVQGKMARKVNNKRRSHSLCVITSQL
jgi:hypothetical protein